MNKIENRQQLFATITQIHVSCFKLCKQAFGKYLPVAGNMGVFCHYDGEYELLDSIREEITEPSDNPNQKYFLLCEPIVIPKKGDAPETVYTHLYIRKPDPTSYGRYAGDVDFVLDDKEYASLKTSLLNGKVLKGAQIYDRPGWDMIQLSDPKIDSVAFVGTDAMTKKLRVKF